MTTSNHRMMPPTLTPVDELTAAQIKRIYGLGFAAGLKNVLPGHEDDALANYAQEIDRLRRKDDERMKVIESQAECIRTLRRDLKVTRIAALVLLLTIFMLLLVLAARREEMPDLVNHAATGGSGRA